jgi:hypothetical protein
MIKYIWEIGARGWFYLREEKKMKSDNIQMDRTCGAVEGAEGCSEET